MALQGDLSSFALPEVLRLLAGTAKSGRLEVHGPGTSGELGLLGGGIAHGELHGAARSSEPGEVLFELLRQGVRPFEELERYIALEPRIVGAPHHAKRAAPQLLQQAVAA